MNTARINVSDLSDRSLPADVEQLVDASVARHSRTLRMIEKLAIKRFLKLLLLTPAEIHDLAVRGTLPMLVTEPDKPARARKYSDVVSRQEHLSAREKD